MFSNYMVNTHKKEEHTLGLNDNSEDPGPATQLLARASPKPSGPGGHGLLST